MIIDIPTQFAKLCPDDPQGLPAAEQLAVVDKRLGLCRKAGARSYWGYDLNRHIALHELRTALIDQILARRAA